MPRGTLVTRRLWDVFIRLFCIYILILTFFAGLSGPPIDMPEWIPVVLVALALLLAAVIGPAEYIEWRRRQSAAVTSDDAPANPSPEPDAASRLPGAPPTDQ